MNLTDKFLQLALLGANWVLWILVILSMASVAIMIERWLHYRSLAGKDADLTAGLNQDLADRDFDAASAKLKGKESPGARIVAGMLAVADKGAAAAGALMSGSRASEKIRLERNLAFLGTVGSNAPFIGLFGTVLEILRVFNLMGEEGVTSGDQAGQIMTGISEALVATAIGLLVAIPAVIAYNSFTRRVKRLMSEADALSGMALSQLSAEVRGDS
jgi:biopolymer transport protein ExbB